MWLHIARTLVLASLSIIPIGAKADTLKAINGCRSISDKADRLSCYDKAASGIAQTLEEDAAAKTSKASKAPTRSVGAWRVESEINPLDDTKSVFAGLEASSGKGKWGEPVGLIARCVSNKTELYIGWNTYLGNDGGIYNNFKRVMVRIGDAPSKTMRWGLSTDSQATFAPGWAGTLIKQMMGVQRLVARVIPYNENPIVAEFDLTGIEDAMKPIMQTCGWKR